MNQHPVIQEEIVKECHHHHKFCCVKCISWSAIITGAFVAIGLGFLMNLFGIAIGLSAFKTSPEGVKTLAIGGYFGLLIGTVVIMFAAGWVSGYLGRGNCLNRDMGALYGFTTWSLTLIMTVLLASQLSQFTISNSSLDYPSRYAQYNISGTRNSEAPIATQSTHSDTHAPTNTTIVVNEEKAAHLLGLSLLLTFALFIAGALASCFGGYFGLGRCKKEEMKSHR